MAKASAKRGSLQRRRSSHGRQRAPKRSQIFKFRRPDVELGKQQFRIILVRKDKGDIDVSGLVTQLDWNYQAGDPIEHGTITLNKSHPSYGHLDLHDGYQIKVLVYYEAKWIELWRMRMDNGRYGLTGNTWQAELNDDGVFLQESGDDFHYTKSKHGSHPNGWLTHEIVHDIAKRYHIPLGRVAEGKHRITNLSETDTSPLAVIQKAYALERKATGRRFVIQWEGSKLNVVPMQRNVYMYIFKDQIRDAQLGLTARDSDFATAVTVKASIKQHSSHNSQGRSGTSKKLSHTFTDPDLIKKYGFVHKTIDGGEVSSAAAADKRAKKYIADHGKRKRIIEGMTHTGIALIKRGDAVDVEVPSEGYHGEKAICFVNAGTWSLAGGDFSMALDLTFDDPWKGAGTKRKSKDKKTRDHKRSTRGHQDATTGGAVAP